MTLPNNVVDLPIQTKAETSAVSLTTRIYERLRHDILSGALAPDKKLRIDEIREVYGIGASAIREALSLLTSEALVERIDHRGFRVSPISKTGFDELLATRGWLEERALREVNPQRGRCLGGGNRACQLSPVSYQALSGSRSTSRERPLGDPPQGASSRLDCSLRIDAVVAFLRPNVRLEHPVPPGRSPTAGRRTRRRSRTRCNRQFCSEPRRGQSRRVSHAPLPVHGRFHQRATDLNHLSVAARHQARSYGTAYLDLTRHRTHR